MNNKKIAFPAFLSLMVLGGGVAWRQSVTAQASETVRSNRAYGCRSVCVEYKNILMTRADGSVHKQICANAKPACDLVAGN